MFVDTCVYIHLSKKSFNDSLKTCIGNNQRLINFPNSTYPAASLNLSTTSRYWIGVQRNSNNGNLSDLYWLAGNTTYSVVENKFTTTASGKTCFYLVNTNSTWVWSGNMPSFCTSLFQFICQQPLSGKFINLFKQI